MYVEKSSKFVGRFILVLLITLLLLFYYDYTRRETFYNVYINDKLANFTGVEDFIPPFINIVTDLFVAPEYKIAACGIRKSMSQLTINTMCLLYDTESFKNSQQSMNDTWKTQGACANNDPNFRTLSKKLKNDSDLTRIAFIRDPLDRFISFYLDKCLREKMCWKCEDDVLCVVRNLYHELSRFKVHRDYKPTYIEMHAAPLSWNCDFDTQLSKYNLFMMGANSEDRRSSILHLANILSSKHVPQNIIKTIVDGSLNGETDHGTHKSSKRLQVEKLVRTNSVIRDYLQKIYFYDYLIFNFNRQVLDDKYQTDFWNTKI